jgi:hypothetical protein
MHADSMGSLSEYERTADAAHGHLYRLVWSPTYRRPLCGDWDAMGSANLDDLRFVGEQATTPSADAL